MALYRACPMPKVEVETLVNTLRLTKKVSDNHLPSEEEERASSSGAEATCGMMSMRNFSNEDNVKALISLGAAWRMNGFQRLSGTCAAALQRAKRQPGSGE